jgi:hypothetical protein
MHTHVEITITIPVAGAAMTIPTRERIFEPGVGGGRIVDSVHTAALDDLRSVELDGGQLYLELQTGERYRFPIAELLTDGQEKLLHLRDSLQGRQESVFGAVEKARLHELLTRTIA